MKFHVLSSRTWPSDIGKDTICLKKNNWNDFSFVTLFEMSLHDENGQQHDIGAVRIGFKGQTIETATYSKLPETFESLSDEFFSLGSGIDYYKKLASLPDSLGNRILSKLHDIVIKPDLIDYIKDEKVFSISLLRDVSLSVVKGQYARILEGKAELTDFKFSFISPKTEYRGGLELDFNVKVNSTPSTNIHAIIGRNGVGKTTLLNSMIQAITDDKGTKAMFVDSKQYRRKKISNDYFSSLVSISFSAFDPFTPPREQPDPAKGTCYFYVGLKDPKNGKSHRTINNLREDCVTALIGCFYNQDKAKRWLKAIDKLGSDENFASMRLEQLHNIYCDIRNGSKNEEQAYSSLFKDKYSKAVDDFLSEMSSGHAIVLLTITRLVATVEEKTLVLFDEPESHLHPPLLSALVRSLSDLLDDRNGVAIIATHSPVVLQEIPHSCVWKIYRVGTNISATRPTIKTFAENVGVLTNEVFSLEVERSGFHDLLAKSVEGGRTYNEIVDDYNGQIGFEGKAILKALIANRQSS